jgi:6-phosphogluconolactonase
MTASDDVLHSFSDSDEMVAALAGEIVSRLRAGILARSSASLVVSGGSTPGALFDSLSARSAPWQSVCITLSDERWIAPDRDGSNEKLVRTRLLRDMAAAARFVGLKTADALPQAAEAAVGAAVAAMPRPFDVVVLGMGDDGHTASLFPNAVGLDAALDTSLPDLVRAIHANDATATGERMSLTLRAILDSRLIVILIRGDAKLAAYRRAAAGTEVLEAPVRAVLHQTRTPVQVFWAP